MVRWVRYLVAGSAGAALLAAAAIAAAPRPLRAAEAAAEAPRVLSVTGRATVEARPDAARVSFGVSQAAPTAAEAYAATAAAASRIVDALRARGVPEPDLQTTGLSLHAEYDYDKEGTPHLRGYRATNGIVLTTRNLAAVGSLLDAAVAAGANSVSGIEFYVWDPGAHLQGALDRAVDDARAKADRVAGRLGTAVTGVVRVQVLDEGSPPPVVHARAEMAMPAAAPARPPMPVLSGTSRYQVTVSVEFSLR